MSVATAFEYHLAVYRRVWKASVLSSFVLPVFFLVAMGVSVGGYVDSRSNGLGAGYLDWIAPGVLASTALQVAIAEATWPVFANFTWTRIYHGQRASPLRVGEILGGHLLFILMRVAVSAAGFLIVLTLFGAVHSWWVFAALPVAVLVGFACAAPVFAYAATVSNDGLFAVLFRFAVVPMSLFAGVFFPVDSLPLLVRLLAYVSPLWHGVELTRAATLAAPTAWGVGVHAGVLLAWGVLGCVLAHRQFTRKLTD